ncbi:hypothetical protein NQD34_001694 [Periophthalmus magnuspinnatus]|nr:hypothetical protein NQD34_001694 [Periophthalmus magnuspinnatus]
MEHPGEYHMVLGQILSELKSKHQSASHPELCRWLCSRFDLVHLAKVRSLLFHTASQDPSFPSTLFRDRMCCSSVDPHYKKLQVAVDILSMFNLIQNRSPAKERLPMSRAPLLKNHSVGGSDYCPPHPLHGSAHSPKPGPESNQHQFIPASEPNFLLRVNKDLKCRAASLDKLHPLPLYGPGTLGPSCEMQSTYFPMEADSEASTEQESLSQPQSGPQEPLSTRSCVHKRNIFKEDFHNMSTFSPKVIRQASECAEGVHQRDLHRPAVFFNHSFELPCTNPYMDPGLNSPLEERQRAKHESLDDLQASTYFGPSTVSQSVSTRRFTDREPESTHKSNTKSVRPTRPVKSFSLNTEYVPSPSTRPMATKRPLRNMPAVNGDREPSITTSPAFTKKVSDFKGQELIPLSNGPVCVERKEGRTVGRGFHRGEVCPSVGTQTDQGSEPRRLRSFSRTDSEMISDDISDIFRFLDDMSVCDSLNMVQSSCYNSTGSLSQLTLRSDSSPERSTVRLAKSRLDSLFHSLDNSDDELKSNVHRLVQRIGEIEKKLESLSGVRSEITQLLSKLNQLDHKVHKADSADGTDPAPAHSDTHPSPQAFQYHTIAHSNGHSTGHIGGHSTGQSTGHLRAHIGGQTGGAPSGQTSGHLNGHTDVHTSGGHTLGHSTVHFTGHTSGHSTGLTGGHSNGHTSGHSNGHTSGHSNGHTSGHTGGHSNPNTGGHTSGHTTGHTIGHTGGHSNGHTGVHTNGHSNGHSNKQHSIGHSRTLVDWSNPQGAWGSPGESLGVKALKNSLRRSSRSLNQEPAPDWSTTAYCTERPRTHREVQQEHPYELSRVRRGSTDFPPQPYTPSLKKHLQSPLCTPTWTPW